MYIWKLEVMNHEQFQVIQKQPQVYVSMKSFLKFTFTSFHTEQSDIRYSQISELKQ